MLWTKATYDSDPQSLLNKLVVVTLGVNHVTLATVRDRYLKKSVRLIFPEGLRVKNPNLIFIILAYRTTIHRGMKSTKVQTLGTYYCTTSLASPAYIYKYACAEIGHA